MFSKSKINEPGPKAAEDAKSKKPEGKAAAPAAKPAADAKPAAAAPDFATAKPKAAASVISTDLTVTGNLKTAGELQVEGTVEGDIRAHLLTVGETATIKGEVVADDVVVHGRILGRVLGLKVRLSSTAKVEGDIIHKTIAIESGAHFEGSVQRADDPIGASPKAKAAAPAAK